MAATDLERLVVTLEASAKKFENELKRANSIAQSQTNAISRKFDGLSKGVETSMQRTAKTISKSLSSTALTNGFNGMLGAVRSFGGAFAGALGAAFSVSALRDFADEWQAGLNKIRAGGEVFQAAGDRQSQLADIAIRSRTGLEATVSFYTGLKRATEDLKPSQAQLLAVTEGVNKAFKVGGATTSEAAAGILQLNQALGSGVLQGDELRSLRENAPLIAKAIADAMGQPVSALKKLGSEGKITSDVVFRALLNLSKSIDTPFKQTTATIEDSLGNLRTALTRYFGELDQQYGISNRVAQGLQYLADNAETVAKVAAVAGAALLGAFGGPVAAGISAATAAIVLFSDSIHPIPGELATLADYAKVAFDLVKQSGAEAWAALSAAVAPAIDTIVQALTGIGADAATSMQSLLDAVKTAVNAVIGSFNFAVDTIKATWNTLGPAIAQTIISAMNSVIKVIEDALKKVVDSINTITGTLKSVGIDIPKIPPPDLGEINPGKYKEAGAAAAKAYGEAFKNFSKDYVGDSIKSVDEALKRIQASANQMAAIRRRDQLSGRKDRDLGPGDGDIDQKLAPLPPQDGGKKGGSKSKSENEFQREVGNIEKQITAYGREQDALRLSAFEAAKAEAAFKLLDAAKAAGVPITDELKGKVDKLAESYATAKTSLEQAKEAQQQFIELQKFAGNAISGFLSDIISGGENAQKALSNLIKKLAEAVLQATLLGEGPLGGLLGGGKSKSGMGGLIGNLFGLFAADGGYLGGFARGGKLIGPGTSRSDSILASNGRGKFARFSNGEFITNADETRRWGWLLELINSGKLTAQAKGQRPGSLDSFREMMARSGIDFPAFAGGGFLTPASVAGVAANVNMAASAQPGVVLNMPMSFDARGASADAIPALRREMQIMRQQIRQEVPKLVLNARVRGTL